VSPEGEKRLMIDMTEIKVGIARIEEQLKFQADLISKLAPAAEVAQLRHDVADIENRQRDMEKEFISQKTHDSNRKDDCDRIEKLESAQTWLIRTIIGFVIAAVMGLVVTSAKKIGLG
jgi:hypothetical protein